MTPFERKKQLRKEMLCRRKSLQGIEKSAKDTAITKKLLDLDKVRKVSVVLPFVSTKDEVDTSDFIAECIKNGKTVAVPRCKDECNMEFCVITSFSDLEKGMYGIYEPKVHCTVIKAEDITDSVLIVPGLCFNNDGFRLGYGKGYYDRFISRYKGYSIGVCYKEFLTDEIPTDEYDKPVDTVITDR